MEKITAQVGDFVEPDEWRIGETLDKADDFSDGSFPGCQFRMHSYTADADLAVNIKVTGKPHLHGYDRYKSHCKIEFVGDGEPSTFAGGWIYTKQRS